MRWRIFDHFVCVFAQVLIPTRQFNIENTTQAHLGGASLGVAYMQFGSNHMWPQYNTVNTVRNQKEFVGNNGKGGGDKTLGALMGMPERICAKLSGKKTVVVLES